MTHIRLKLSVAAILLLSAVAYLTFAGVQKGWVYTVGVDQFAANVEQHALRVRLCGTVSDEHLDVQKARLTANFLIKGEHATFPVLYHGVIPDMFKAGSEVVVEGRLNDAGQFQADTLMTKCASKYEGMPKNHPAVANANMVGGQS
ncbi:MAG TPA: cytochrome c maturation protein CcmE [Phycisphaerae bacterium]|nr:cytochrome c maturation protein CcmE [Phycisphaerae bacterium]